MIRAKKILIALLRFMLLMMVWNFASLPSSAQVLSVDSLIHIAITAKQDTAVIDAYRLAAIELIENDPEKALSYARISLKIAEQKGYKLRTAQSAKILGISFDYKGDLDSCLYYLKLSSALFASIGMKDWQSHAISDIAIAYYFRGNYELALRNNLQALELRKGIGNKDFIAKSLNNIGLIYRARKDYSNAVKVYMQSLIIKRELHDDQGILNTCMNIGSVYQNQGLYDSAYKYAVITRDLAEKLNADEDIVGSKLNIGSALLGLNKPDQAFSFLEEAELLAERKNYRQLIRDLKEPMGDYYLAKKNFDKAAAYFGSGLIISKNTGRKEQQEIFYQQLAKCFVLSGDYHKAYLFQDSSRQIADTLLNEENLRQINELTQVYQTAEKENEISHLNAEKVLNEIQINKRMAERNYFILASFFLMIFSFFAYKAYTSNKRKKEKLNKQNKIIEASLHEKEILLKEIHHRVKNNLQVVSSLLSLQSHYIKDELALDAVKESRNRVHSMGMIHQKLYQDDNLTGIFVADYINELCNSLLQSYAIHPGRVQLLKDIEDFRLDVDALVPLGLILNELITNCLKYAFPGERKGLIHITFNESEAGIKLSVHDNGIGIGDYDPLNSSSFGFKMIHAFMKKMKGSINISSESGTKVEITITQYKDVHV